jgi:hypothetical protein
VGPVLEYGHDAQGGNSVTGGYRYRGKKSRPLRGFYISGYFVSSRVWAAEFNGAWSTSVLVEPPSLLTNISSLGEDEAGELYVASFRSGIIFAIDGPGPAVVRNQAICKAPLLSICSRAAHRARARRW